MVKILENFGLQLGFSIGLLALLGFGIWLLDCLILRLLGGKAARRVFMTTGAVGVPVHEFGHLFFCVLFFHKVKDVRLFEFNPKNGTLGYVRHAYNRKNLFQQIGNFFIGIGPLLVGGAVIIGLMFLFVPSAAKGTIEADNLWQTVASIFAPANLISFWWWIFILLAASIAMHMSLSFADIKGSLIGLLFIAPILFVVNVLLYLFNSEWVSSFTGWMVSGSSLIISFLAIALLLLSALVLVIAFVRFLTRRRRWPKKVADARSLKNAKREAEQESRKQEKERAAQELEQQKEELPDSADEIS